MKTINLLLILLSALIIFEFSYCVARDSKVSECRYEGEECPNYYKGCKGHTKPVSVEYYKQGDTLFPSYACADTLIVVDAKGLNKDWGFIEQSFINVGDEGIDSVLHEHCRIK